MKLKSTLAILMGLFYLASLFSNPIYAVPAGSCATPAEGCDSGLIGVFDDTCSVTETRCTTPSASNPNFSIPTYGSFGLIPSGFKFSLSVSGIGELLSSQKGILPFAYVFAGILLFAYLLYGAFHLATSFGSPKAILEAWLIIFRAVSGFIIIFASFWLVRAIEALFGLCILGNCG